MNRRTPWLIISLVCLFAGYAEAQQGKMYRIGYLNAASAAASMARMEALRQGLRELGHVEGENIVIEWRHADGNPERIRDLASQLLHLRVDVVVSASGALTTRAAREVTQTLPIVMAQDSDPLGSGFVSSLARPGSNVTGISTISIDLSGKRLELFREAFPQVHRLAVLWYTGNYPAFRETKTAAAHLTFSIRSLEVRAPEDLHSAFALVTKERLEGLFPVTSAFMTANRKRIVEFAAKNRLPALYSNKEFVEDGGLMSYAANVHDMHRRAASYVDRILRGAKPADLPVEQPAKFELVINLKTAKQIGLTIPPHVLARADRVIK